MPVGAIPRTCLPASSSGRACIWMGVGVVSPRLSSVLHIPAAALPSACRPSKPCAWQKSGTLACGRLAPEARPAGQLQDRCAPLLCQAEVRVCMPHRCWSADAVAFDSDVVLSAQQRCGLRRAASAAGVGPSRRRLDWPQAHLLGQGTASRWLPVWASLPLAGWRCLWGLLRPALAELPPAEVQPGQQGPESGLHQPPTITTSRASAAISCPSRRVPSHSGGT